MPFLWRRKYNLPETDPRYLDMTREEMLTDLWAHKFADDPKAADQIEAENPDFDADFNAMLEGDEPNPNDFEDI